MSEEQQVELEGVLMPKDMPATETDLIAHGHGLGVGLQGVAINSAETLESAGESMKMAAAQLKVLEKTRKDRNKPYQDYISAVNAAYKVATDELNKGLKHAKSELSRYQFEVQEQQRKEAEAEAARIQKNAEKRAERQERKGDDEAAQRAEDIRMQAEMEAESAKAAINTQEKPKADGVSTRKNWKAEVVDLGAFIGAIAAGKDPRLKAELLKVNQPALNKLVKALEDGLKDVPGLRVFYEDVVSVRSK